MSPRFHAVLIPWGLVPDCDVEFKPVEAFQLALDIVAQR
jgi:hypothetical protein